ncbi:hypothetical protein OXPF_39730 [Oxobacter pfennigii]|uniref:Helix-turn-helix domain protein n=1 Tax=Oxobacter pfennigii TaxID=36849 RepID=A0A0P8W439_9CLOT|nr:helix-turn-helix domain-containing protein [Oxobacter pfennigii]KPU42194.1 hypothetical protein OXPF_39730 [Oxobacter pfennigii]
MDFKYYTAKELAAMFNVTTVTIKKEFERKKLNGFLVGNELRCSQRDVDEYTNFLKYGKTSKEIELEGEVENLTKKMDILKKLLKDVHKTFLEADAAL